MSKDVFSADYCAQRLKALGDPLRLRIVEVLRTGELTVGDIAAFLESPVVTMSHHLQILRRCDLLTTRRDGRFIYYSLAPELLQSGAQQCHQFLNLGCCRLEVPTE